MARIEDLKRRLYTRDGHQPSLRRSSLTQGIDAGDPSLGWSNLDGRDKLTTSPPWRSRLTVFLLAAVIFFLTAISFAAYTLYRGGNVISPANVELLADGPKTIKAGETLNFQILVANRNTSPLRSADLIVEFAPGTRSPLDVTKELSRARIPLDTIAPGASANQAVRAVVFGDKDTEQQIKISVEYRIADSNAIFDKVSFFRYQISASPVTLNLTLPTEVNSGQAANLDLELATANDAPLRDLTVVAAYPPGFTFTVADPPPAIGTNIWRLGDVPAGTRPHLKISGKLEGQDDDAKSFRFSVGMESQKNEGEIAVSYGEIFKVVTIKRPFVALEVLVNGDSLSQEYVADSAQPTRVDLVWTNNLSTEVTDGEVLVTLSGAALDQRTVVTSNGFYQSATNQILWRHGTLPALDQLAPGDHRQVSFNFASVPLVRADRLAFTNPLIEVTATFRGRRVTEEAGSETIETTVRKQVKINSVFQLAATAAYHDGPFTNRGPLPPRVGQETTYTVFLSVINSSNEVGDAKVEVTLPAYVRWLGAVSPDSEKVTFDDSRGEITWDLGAVDAGRGLESAARQAAFQVALLPSVSQVGETPVLITTPTLTGTDSFTHRALLQTKRSVDIQITGDSRYQTNYGTVAQ